MTLLLLFASDGPVMVGQAVETDTARVMSSSIKAVLQASETDTATILTRAKSRTLGQSAEADTAQAVAHRATVQVARATETDTARSIQPRVAVGQITELDRAKQIAATGGSPILPIPDFPGSPGQFPGGFPVLIRAPLKAGRTFIEVWYDGESYHPNVADPQAEEEAPGGWMSFTGRISEKTYQDHHDVFVPGARLLWWHEDGTLLHRGKLLEPDTSDGAVQISDRGDAAIADREVGPILYQANPGPEVAPFGGHSRWWSVRSDIGNQSDATIVFERERSDLDTDAGAWAIIPYFGRELAHMRFQVTGDRAFIEVYVTRKLTALHANRPGDISLLNMEPVWIANFNPNTSLFTAQIELDLTLKEDNTTLPQSALNNYANTEISFVYPDCVIINVGDDGPGTNDASVELVDIEINGAAVGERRQFSAADLVADIAAVLGIRNTSIEGGGFDILPYELPPGAPAAEALDYASLLSGKRWRICGNGLEFGNWREHEWGLASPWAPFDAIPQERFDAVSVPFRYAGTDLDDQVVVRMEDSPLDRRNIYWGLSLADMARNRDKAEGLAGHIAETMSRKRNSGSFSAAELIGPDGERTTAHHANAGDALWPMRPYVSGRLHISGLTRFEDHIEGTFDGENHALEKMLARREKGLRWGVGQ